MTVREQDIQVPDPSRRKFLQISGRVLLSLPLLAAGCRSKEDTEEVNFLFSERSELTTEEFQRQFDLVFYRGVNFSPNSFADSEKDKFLKKGEYREGVAVFDGTGNKAFTLEKGKSNDLYGVDYTEPKVYREVNIAVIKNSVPAKQTTLVVVEGTNPLIFTGGWLDVKNGKEATPEELFEIAQELTQQFNFALRNHKILKFT